MLVGLTASIASAVDFKLLILQRMADTRVIQSACSPASNWQSDRCVLDGVGWRGVAAAAVAIVKDFNDRNGRIIPAFAQEPIKSCDKRMVASLVDSGSTGPPSTKALLDAVASGNRPHMIIGPARSAASIPSALVAGSIYQIPQISYWATSAKLDDTATYPLFMRMIPTDDAAARAVILFWKSLGYRHASMLFINDPYGEAYKESLVKWGTQMGIAIQSYPYDEGAESSIHGQVDAMKASGIQVQLMVGFGKGFKVAMQHASSVGMTGPGKLWTFTDATVAEDFQSLPANVLSSLSNSVRIIAAGATDKNPVWQGFTNSWANINFTDVNSQLPAFFQMDPNAGTSFDIANNDIMRDIATYEIDAIAAAGLMACRGWPTGPLPADFGPQVWATKTKIKFNGTSGQVCFTEAAGNRALHTANYQLANVIVNAGGIVSFRLVQTLVDGNWVQATPGVALQFPGNHAQPPPGVTVPPHDKNFASTGFQAGCWLMFGVNMSLAIFFAGWVWRFRREKIVNHSQPLFLIIICVGCMTSTSTIVAMIMAHDHGGGSGADGSVRGVPADYFEQQPFTANQEVLFSDKNFADQACAAQLWLYFLGFTISFGGTYVVVVERARGSRAMPQTHTCIYCYYVWRLRSCTVRKAASPYVLAVDCCCCCC